MKKQKRDLTTRTYQRGYHAGINSKSQDRCPYEQGELRRQWLSGWRDGRSAQWDGYTGVAGVHRTFAQTG